MLIFLKGLTRATRLVKLHLRSQCSDAVLATVAASCPLLRQIDISRSEQVKIFRTGGNLLQRMASAGHWSGHRLWAETPPLLLISCVRQRSQVLGSHPCWRGRFNQFDISTTLQLSLIQFTSYNTYVGLLLALPHIRLLFFANMTAVMEEISKDEKDPVGPFFLEHFDNSDYSLAMPEDGVSSHNADFLKKSFLSRLVPLGWTASPPLPTSPPPSPTSPAAD